MCRSEGIGEIKEAFSDGISSLADDSGSRVGGVWIRRFAFSQDKNESREHLNARNKTARSAEEVANLAEQESRQAVLTERLKAMREYASAAGGLKAKGK